MPTHKKIFTATLFAGFLVWGFLGQHVLGIDHVLAASDATTPTGLHDLLETMGVFFDFLMVVMYTCLKLLATLLDPDVITDINNITIGGDGGPSLLQYLWMISRNIVNVILAFVLIIVALYTTFTGSDIAKEMAMKFVAAVILVNFSWFFAWVIFDVANVLTATIYSLPSGVSGGEQCKMVDYEGETKIESECLYVKKVHLFAEDSATQEARDCVTNADMQKNSNLLRHWGFICVELDELPEDANTGLGMLHGLYVNHIRILGLGKVVSQPTPADGGWASMKELIRFAVQFIFVTFYAIAAVFPLAAMLIAFLIRIPIIWLTVAGMPFMFIGFVLGERDMVGTMGVFKLFLRAVFLPVIVAAALAVGFILINAGLQGDCTSLTGPMKHLCEPSGFRLDGLTTWWQLLWSFIAMAIMWLGTFAAFNKMEGPFAAIGGFFQSVGGKWGKFFAQAPLATPIIPAPVRQAIRGAGQAIVNPNRTLIAPDGTLRMFGQEKTPMEKIAADPAVRAELKKINETLKKNTGKVDKMGLGQFTDIAAQLKAKGAKTENVQAILEHSTDIDVRGDDLHAAVKKVQDAMEKDTGVKT